MLVGLAGGVLAGASSQLLWPVLPSVSGLLLAALLAAAAAMRGVHARRLPAATVAGFAFGMALASLHAGEVLAARLPADSDGTHWLIEVRVLSVARRADGGQTLMVATSQLPWQVQPASPWRPDWRLRLGSFEPLAAQPGERWQLPVKLRRPHAAQNPGVADFERWMLGERVVATGFLRSDSTAERLAPAAGWAALRGRLLDGAMMLLGEGPGDIAASDGQRFARAVLPALVLDERGLLSAAQWRLLGDTGTAHLVAISGLHVALLWGACLWLAGLALRRRTGSLRFRLLAVLPALLLAAGYAQLAGMPLPAARAVMMLAVASAFLVFSGDVPAWRVWLAAGSVTLLLDPLAVHDAGFWLSFGAVALLLLLADVQRRPHPLPRRRWPGLAGEALHMQAALSLWLAPVLMGLFGAASVSSVLANLPAIPLVNLLALPPALAGFLLAPWAPSIADPLLDLATGAMTVLWDLLAWIDGFALLTPLRLPAVQAWQVVLFSVLLPLLWLARDPALRLALLCLAALAWPRAEPLPPGVAQACVLDIGHGLAAIVRTQAHAVIYDTGPGWGERDAGDSVVVPAARALGADRVDLLVVSHDDGDHAGGASAVAELLKPVHILLGDPDTRARLSGRGELCERRRLWRFDGVEFTVYPGDAGGDDNDRSCVLHIRAGRHALLFTGDSSRRRELDLLAAHGEALTADVLVAGHHGSRSASSATFLHAIVPAQVIFPAGHGNRFGHPHAEVQARVARIGAQAQVTGEQGALCFRLGAGTPPLPVGQRGIRAVFWRR